MAPGIFEVWLDATPLWGIALVILIPMLLAAVGGRLLHRRHERRRIAAGIAEDGSKDLENYVVSAVLGLLALLMGFTFALAVDRFDTRRLLVLEEANAIGATYLRTQLLDEPHRARISRTLVAYADNRLAIASARRPEALAMLPANDAIITDLWTETVAAFPSMKDFDFSSSYLESMNHLIDLNASRKMARLARVPPQVFFVLFLYLIVTAGSLGYVLTGRRGQKAASILLLLNALSMLLIIDIDQPTSGSILESQAPMQHLKSFLASQPPAIFDRLDDVP